MRVGGPGSNYFDSDDDELDVQRHLGRRLIEHWPIHRHEVCAHVERAGLWMEE